ncbi:MAG: type II toxin-antitoxin system HipA family toxin [Bacteroidales bacterium]|nr:type II toxin-antitoxin system HipA family toxin [Bacteroidales bacterium]
MVDYAYLKLWNSLVGAIIWDEKKELGIFEFDPDFVKRGLNLAPITMPISELQAGNRIFSFPGLNRDTYSGLPGMIADSLPDQYGNLLIDAWLSRQGRTANSFTPVERLCYMGKRSMGAFEFEPVLKKPGSQEKQIEVTELIELAREVLSNKDSMNTDLGADKEKALEEIIKVGTSAGGARAKAVIAINEESGIIRSGQAEVPEGFRHWILKFDGVDDIQFGATHDYGRIEYAYYLMALDCGINMMESRLLEESGRAHFLTRRFDRLENNDKLFMQTLCAIAHYDYNQPGVYSYEQAFGIMRRLYLPYSDAEQLYRRMCFNVMAKNLDDHTKNISFRMSKDGEWRLSPAYDIIYSYNPTGRWTSRHQLSINGKREDLKSMDLMKVAKEMNINQAVNIIKQVREIVSQWPDYAKRSNLNTGKTRAIGESHLLL